MDKREKIIKTATRLFVKQGFENTPTSQISKEAEVATGTLFHHFKTKEDLINTAYIHAKKRIVEETSENYVNEKDVKKGLKQAWFSSITWGYNNRTEVDFSFKFANSVYITKLSKEQAKTTLEPFTNIIAQGRKEGLFKEIPQKVLEKIYYGIYRSFLDYLCESKKLDKKIIAIGFDVLWDAIKK